MRTFMALARGTEDPDEAREAKRGRRRRKKDDYYQPPSQRPEEPAKKKKDKKIRKLRMRLGRKKQNKNKNKKHKYEDEAVHRTNRSRRADSTDDEDVYGYSDDPNDGFQLDNVRPGSRPNQRFMDDNNGVDSNKRVRVKPFHAFASPTYLNETELYQHMMAPSEEFEHLTSYLNPSTKATRRVKVSEVVRRYFGSPKDDGRIGSLRVEVLGCVGLDRAKPEISVYLVAGDCAFSTDIIQGPRSPIWPYSSKRAAVFPLHHAFARLFVGVFDVKERKKNEADHFCGRISIDIPAIRPDTEYDITFPLRASSFIYDRRPRGVVRLRFSLHWFSERAVIMSYMKRPRNPLAFSKQAKKQPTIPCGDPKTFRNVAVTVHGQDFPGKYTRGAFRATMREFNLYQQNLRFLFKITILDCILYENPLMSLYLFSASLYCVWLNSVRYVPPFFIGWIIYMLTENYLNHCASVAGHLGYQPLTIMEVLKGLIRDGKDKKFNFQPIHVKKRPRRQVLTEDGKTADIELANHREFPFSERFEYLKFAASDAIAPSPADKKKKGRGSVTDAETARRLSIYMSPVEEKDGDSEEESDEDDDSEQGDRDDEGMMDQADDGFENMDDSDDEPDEDEENEGPSERKGKIFSAGKASTTRRIRVGPAQNSDKSGRKVPPQVHLSRVEHMLHRATKNISVEHVHFPPPHIQLTMGKDYDAKGPASDVITTKEKQNFDEFDRLLGFRTKNPNPILRITSSFLGPLMRIIRIVIYATRISFNVTTWTDPFLTFWFFAALWVFMIILFIFPWRTFFFVVTILLLGPQNIFVRKYLERRAREKEIEEQERKEFEEQNALAQGAAQSGMDNLPPHVQGKLQQQKQGLDVPAVSKGKNKGGRWGRSRKNEEEEEPAVDETDLYHSPRPAFYAHTRPPKRTQVPRDVAVPYFRFRKDRFYDWPPDPTVSRATPILQRSEDNYDVDGSRHHRRGQSQDDYDYEDEEDDGYGDFGEEPSGVRQRKGRNHDQWQGGHPAYS